MYVSYEILHGCADCINTLHEECGILTESYIRDNMDNKKLLFKEGILEHDALCAIDYTDIDDNLSLIAIYLNDLIHKLYGQYNTTEITKRLVNELEQYVLLKNILVIFKMKIENYDKHRCVLNFYADDKQR